MTGRSFEGDRPPSSTVASFEHQSGPSGSCALTRDPPHTSCTWHGRTLAWRQRQVTPVSPDQRQRQIRSCDAAALWATLARPSVMLERTRVLGGRSAKELRFCQHEAVGHPRHEPESFADLVHKVRSTARAERTDARPWPQPISDGYWIDDSGIHWHIRGGRAGLSRPALRRLLRHSDLRVLHAYGLHPMEVVGAERAALLERVERYFAGEAPAHSAFRLAEFRDDDRRVMVVIEERC